MFAPFLIIFRKFCGLRLVLYNNTVNYNSLDSNSDFPDLQYTSIKDFFVCDDLIIFYQLWTSARRFTNFINTANSDFPDLQYTSIKDFFVCDDLIIFYQLWTSARRFTNFINTTTYVKLTLFIIMLLILVIFRIMVA